MEEEETAKVEAYSDAEINQRLEEGLRKYLKTKGMKGSIGDAPSPDCATFFASVLISRGVERQRAISKGILDESKTIKRLTWVLIVLTGVLIILTSILVYLTCRLLS
jgi:hypothetical protein